MLVLAAPNTDDPRDGGFINTIPGELVTRPGIVCDAGRDGTGCGCERSWSGITSRKGTTLAVVADRTDLTRDEYTAIVTAHYRDVWDWTQQDAHREALMLADLADHYGAGAHITIATDDGQHVFDVLEGA